MSSAGAPVGRAVVAKGENALFDDSSPRLDRFGPLLALTVVAVATLSLVDLYRPADDDWRQVAATAVGLLTGITLLLALRASGVARRWRIVADALFVAAAAVSIALLVAALVTDETLGAFSADRPSPIWAAIAVVSPLAVIRRLVRHRQVTTATMLGAVAAYLLLALAFCNVFLFVDSVQAEPFFAGASLDSTTSFMYFSLVSITTVGYGDLAAATDLGRLLAASEALVGQVYLVTFVAMIVGLRIRQREQAE